MNKQINTKLGIIFLIALTAIVSAYVIFEYKSFSFPSLPPISQWLLFPSVPELKDIEKFSSEDDFKEYLKKSEDGYMSGFMGAARGMGVDISEAMPMALEKGVGGAEPERVSETTVQVAGIDEPDIVKTNGKEIYFSSQRYYWRGLMGRSIEIIPPPINKETKAIKAFPPEDLSIEGKIDRTGDLLLQGDILVIFSGQEIYGYNVSDPKSPKQEWKLELDEKNYVVSARLYKGKIYLVTQNRIAPSHPCPIRPLTVGEDTLTIKCSEIYHPVAPVPVDTTFIALVLDPASGKVEDRTSFVGSSSSSIVYMSEKGIYVSYSYYESIIKFFTSFFKEECRDFIPGLVIEKLEKLESYDISDAAKMLEFQTVLEQYKNSLSSDERLRIENEFTNRMSGYFKVHKRELQKTGIVKIGLNKFEISASGNVPGGLLNQFSLDEYNNYLRVAVTVGGGVGFWAGGIEESVNDVYVLDKNLKEVGSVKDLGITERIYSVRFIQDKGYVVTFRQIDPFYVLDLSDPEKPELKGELKIPGYSSYLHPITKDKILGIGKEGSKVKISLFDVVSPENPSEKDKYILDEYWSDILDTHHAFLLDSKHQIFFMPGNRGGYVFSYQGDKLELKRAVSDIRARRAIYINDYLYIIGDDKIVVLNEINWEEVKTLKLET